MQKIENYFLENNKAASGFSLIELIMVIVIIAIIGLLVTNPTSNIQQIRTYQVAYKIKSDIRYAQSYALSSQDYTRVSFDVASETYSIYYEPTPGNWSIIADPLKKSNFTVDFTSGEYIGVDITQTDFDGTNYGIAFDSAGVPYSYNPSTGTTNLLSSQGSVTLEGDVTINITVEPKTGKVSIE